MLQKIDPKIGEKVDLLLKKSGYRELTPLQKAVIPAALQKKNIIVQSEKHFGQTISYIIPLILQTDFSYPGLKIIIIASSPQNAKLINHQFRKFFVKKLTSLQAVTIGIERNIKKEFRLLLKQPDIIIGTAERFIDHIRRDNLLLEGIQATVIEDRDITDYKDFERDLEFIISKIPVKPVFYAFSEEKDRIDILGQLIKKASVIYREDWKPTTEEKSKGENMAISADDKDNSVKEAIKIILKEVRENADPVELNSISRIIKKNVPFFMRKYFTAYLFNSIRMPEGRVSASGSSTTLFLNTGKNKGLYNGELLRIIKTAADIDKENIKQIRILDNYSFIEVKEDSADIIIEKLNDFNFRGRKFSLSYAKNNRKTKHQSKSPD